MLSVVVPAYNEEPSLRQLVQEITFICDNLFTKYEVIVVDVVADANAVKEARALGVPVIGIVDTNADPATVDYAIPGNDDAIKGLEVLLDYFTAAVQEGAGKPQGEEA